MAAPMIPPAACAGFSRRAWLGGVRDQAAGRRCQLPPLFPARPWRRRTAVLMDAPPPHEDPAPVRRGRANGWPRPACRRPRSSPAISSAGLLLIDDFGDDRLRETLDAAPERETELYALAVDLLVHLHARPPMPGLQPARARPMARRAAALHRLVLPGARPRGRRRRLSRRLARRCSRRSPATARRRSPCCATIMPRISCWSPAAAASRHFGLLDFQDAVAGHPAYDLASVLEDARRDVTPAVERAMLDRYMKATGQGPEFERAYWALAAQRNTRILGVFTRLWKRDGKPHYTAVPAAHVGPARARPRSSGAGAGPRLVRRQRAGRQARAPPGPEESAA